MAMETRAGDKLTKRGFNFSDKRAVGKGKNSTGNAE